MKLTFNINPNPLIPPLDSIRDSMQLDSGLCIASLEADGWTVSLEVRGHVRVIYNPDPEGKAEDGDVYLHASDFPKELTEVFAEGKDINQMPNVFVDENNWFELFIEKDGKTVNCEVVDPDSLLPDSLFKMMYDTYVEYKEEDQRRSRTIESALAFFQGKKVEIMAAVKTEESSGTYPNDCITTKSVLLTDGGHSFEAEVTSTTDRDGEDQGCDFVIVADGESVSDDARFQDLVCECMEF